MTLSSQQVRGPFDPRSVNSAIAHRYIAGTPVSDPDDTFTEC